MQFNSVTNQVVFKLETEPSEHLRTLLCSRTYVIGLHRHSYVEVLAAYPFEGIPRVRWQSLDLLRVICRSRLALILYQ